MVTEDTEQLYPRIFRNLRVHARRVVRFLGCGPGRAVPATFSYWNEGEPLIIVDTGADLV